MAVDVNIYLTGAVGSDGGGPQNDPNLSLGPYRSTTTLSSSDDNLFSKYTEAELVSSTRYRCVAIKAETTSDTISAGRVLANGFSSLPGSLAVEFGIQTNDNLTAAPTCTDSTAPAGITFFTPYDSTGVPATDYALSRLIGPLNLPGDNGSDLDLTPDDRIIFIYIKIVATNVSLLDWPNGTTQEITASLIG